MFKETVWRGRSERSAETYSFWYVEVLSDARAKPTVFFNILLRLTEGAAPKVGGSRLFHRGKRTFLVRIIVPAASPVICGGLRGRYFRAPVPVQRHPIDRMGDVYPIRHG